MDEDARASFRIFRARDGRRLLEAGMTSEGLSERMAADLAVTLDGTMTRVLFSDEAAGMSLAYVWFKPNFALPRHSHDCDCLYYVIAGSALLGAEVLEPGDGFLVPADGLYAYQAGPQGVEVLEFRTATRFNIEYHASDRAWAMVVAEKVLVSLMSAPAAKYWSCRSATMSGRVRQRMSLLPLS